MNASEGAFDKPYKRPPLFKDRDEAHQAKAEMPLQLELDANTADTSVKRARLHPADAPNRNLSVTAELVPSEEADQTAFFHRALELMGALDTVTERHAMIINIQLWVTGGHTSTLEWYNKIGERVQQLISLEDLPDLTEQERAAVTEFMSRAQLKFQHRSNAARPVRRVGWIRRVFGNQ